MTWAGGIRAHKLAAALRERAAAYAATPERAAREAIQLETLNREWARILQDVPYYVEARQRLDLPGSFGSLEEFLDRVPPANREAVQRHGTEMTSHARLSEWVRMSGGSTAQPVRLPAWRSELQDTALDMWLARSWYGVRPDSRLFQIWGHSHLLGSGWRGRVNAVKRQIADRLLGYHRFSAYDMRPDVLRQAGDALLAHRPDYMIGYSVALHQFARANQDRAEPFRAAGLRVVIGTAESFPGEEARVAVARLFGCPVSMEYGAVETGVMAHEHPDGGYRAMWRSFLLEAERSGDGRHLLRVTTLHPRCFPLVRYEIGDEIELDEPDRPREHSIAHFRRVAGRCNDYLEVEGAMIHSEAFAHAVRPCPAVTGFQIVQGPAGARLRYTADAALDETATNGIRERLRRVHPALGPLPFERVERLPQTVAGKTRMVVVEGGPDPNRAERES